MTEKPPNARQSTAITRRNTLRGLLLGMASFYLAMVLLHYPEHPPIGYIAITLAVFGVGWVWIKYR